MSAILREMIGTRPLSVLDIGARGQLLPQFAALRDRVEITGFEPDETECARLNAALEARPALNARVLPYALAGSAGQRPFYVARAPVLSSLLEPNTALMSHPDWQVREIVTVATRTLDDLFAEGILGEAVDFIKLDTQGSELEILQGGETHVLPRVLGIESEAEFVPQYVNQPLFSELEQFLRAHHFVPVVLTLNQSYSAVHDMPLARRRLMACDVVFLRGSTWLASLPPAERDVLLPRLVVVYLAYGLCADAEQLANDYGDPALGERVRAYYAAARPHHWKWRIKMLVQAARCVLNPTRQNRAKCAQLAFRVRADDAYLWQLRDIHKSL